MSKREGTFIVDKQMCNQIINFQVAMIQCKGLIIFNEYVLEKKPIYLLIHDRRRYHITQLDVFFKFCKFLQLLLQCSETLKSAVLEIAASSYLYVSAE